MGTYIGAVGSPLQPPQALYPITINNIPGLAGTNRLSLSPGADVLLPSGPFLVVPGVYSQLQVQDPVTNTWFPYTGSTINEPISVNTDGQNYRIINPTGFPIGAEVNNGGINFTSAPAVAASAGGSTWLAIVGGGVSAITLSGVNGGVGLSYTVPPVVNIGYPPTPGVQATATCTINSLGSITTFTMINNGAGYTSAPAVVIVPQSTDVNGLVNAATVITPATALAQLSFAQTVTAVLLLNEGTTIPPSSQPPALTFSGGGGSATTATAVMAWTLTGVTITTPGSGYATPIEFTTTGGFITSGAASCVNPAVSTSLLVPRAAHITATTGTNAGAASGGTIIDGGLFPAAPSVFVVQGPAGGGTVNAVVTPVLGGTTDTVFITPL
jgi:hypothetical protein